MTVALWSAIVSLAALELVAGLQSGASRGELALEESVGAAMGLSMLALKVDPAARPELRAAPSATKGC